MHNKKAKKHSKSTVGPFPRSVQVLVHGKLVSEFREAANLQQPLLKTRNAHCHHSTQLAESLGEKAGFEACTEYLCSGKGNMSYCQEPTPGIHICRSHLFLHQLKGQCKSRADLSCVSLCSTPLTDLSLWELLGLIPLLCTD